MSIKFNLKQRIIAFILVLISIFSILYKPLTVEATMAKDVQVAYINMMKGQNGLTAEQVGTFTKEDLRVLALFASNVYLPYVTVLDSEEEEEQEATIESLKTLMTTVGFDSKTADELAQQTILNTLETSTDLYYAPDYLKVYDLNGLDGNWPSEWNLQGPGTDGITKGLGTPDWGSYSSDGSAGKYLCYFNYTNTDEEYIGAPLSEQATIEGNQYTLYPCTLGEFSAIMSRLVSVEVNTLDEYDAVAQCKWNQGIPFYSKEGKVVLWLNISTCAKLAYCFETYKKAGIAKQGKILNCLVQSENPETLYNSDLDYPNVEASKYTFFTQKLYVDWVGNILADVGTKRVVIIPAALNDCVFNDGTYNLQEQCPKVNFISLIAMRMVSFQNKSTLFNIKWDFEKDGKKYDIKFDNGDTHDKDAYANGTSTIHKSIAKNKSGYGDVSLVISSQNSGAWSGDEAFGGAGWVQYLADQINGIGWTFNNTADKADEAASTLRAPNFSTNKFSEDSAYFYIISDVKVDANGVKEGGVESVNIFADNGAIVCTASSSLLTDSMGIDKFYAMKVTDGPEKQLLKYILYTYIMAASGYTDDNFTMSFNKEAFPDDSTGVEWEISSSALDDEIKSMVYYFMHPTEGLSFISKWFKNKIGAIFIGWHEDIVGGTNSNTTTGMTKYLSTSSYITTPTLKDVEFLSTLVDYYDIILVFLLVMVMVVLLCYIVIGQMSFFRALSGLCIFALLSMLPPVIINTGIDLSNNICDKIYSQKFQYWSIVQMSEYLGNLSQLNEATSTSDYIVTLLNQQKTQSIDSDETTTFGGVKLKWMSPKHFASFADLAADLEEKTNISSGLARVFTNASASDGVEVFLESDDVTYIYRDILDLYTYSSYGSEITKGYDVSITLQKSHTEGINTTPATITTLKDLRNANLAITKYDDTDYVNTLYLSNGMTYNNIVRANSDDTVSLAQDIINTSSKYAIEHGFLYNTSNDDNYWNADNTTAASNFVGYASALTLIQRNNYFLDGWINGTLTVNTGADNLKTITSDKTKSYTTPDSMYSSIITNMPSSAILGNLNLFYIDAQTIRNNYLNISNADSTEVKCDLNAPVEKNIDIGLDSYTINDKKTIYEGLSMYVFETYSESEYYYFYNNIKDQVYSSDTNYQYNTDNFTASSGNIYKMFLDEDYFMNNSSTNTGYGELRDFMNMHDLFYYVIPVLHAGNDGLYDFVDTYGLQFYDTCPFNYNVDTGTYTYVYDGTTYSSTTSVVDLINQIYADGGELTEQQRYELWHDYNLTYLYNFYSSWVNYMYACDYAKPETIRINGEKFRIEDPLDPTSYFATDESGNITQGRYMVFSRSEMAYYGLEEHQLTSVEKKIIEIQDRVYKETLDLMNYYTLTDESLINAYALLQTFAFNSEFSQESLISEDYIIYPQAYEAKAFTYDAYLRMVIANSNNGITLMSDDNKSIYSRVLENTSIFFGILLIANDFIAVYIIPGLRLFFVFLLFVLSILIIIACALRLEFEFLNILWKSLLAPLLSYVGITVALAYVTSLFMGQMAKGVEVTTHSISLGDPTMTILVMLLLNIVVLIAYFKICKKLWNDFKVYIKTIVDNISAAVVGAASSLVGAVRHSHTRKAENAMISSAKRGQRNTSKSGSVLGGAAAGAAGGALAGSAMAGMGDKTGMGSASGAGGAGAENPFDKRARQQAREDADAKRQAERQQADEARQKVRDEKAARFARDDKDRAEQAGAKADAKAELKKAKLDRKEAKATYKAHNTSDPKKQTLYAKRAKKAEQAKEKVQSKADSKRDRAVKWANAKGTVRTGAQTLTDGVRNVGRGATDLGRKVGRGLDDTVGYAYRTVRHPVKSVQQKNADSRQRGYASRHSENVITRGLKKEAKYQARTAAYQKKAARLRTGNVHGWAG